jgi:hypothetical protein
MGSVFSGKALQELNRSRRSDDSWLISLPPRRDARVKPVHDEGGSFINIICVFYN